MQALQADPDDRPDQVDECEAMPAELSALALEGNGVGLLTGTKSIVGGIAIATMPILAQYLKENTPASCQVNSLKDTSEKQGI